jgi:hypothetical protein
MKKQDYNRVVSNLKADSGLEDRLRRKILSIDDREYATGGLSFKRQFVTLAMTCAVVLVIVFGIPFVPDVRNTAPREGADTPADKVPVFSGFVLTVYAADNTDSVLSPTYDRDTTPVELTPDAEILLPEYSPFMSSVPGLPFTIGYREAGENEAAADSININVDNGEILTWDRKGGTVENKGKSYSCKAGETIYWSPLAEGSIAKGGAVITLTAVKNNEEAGTQKFLIKALDDSGTRYSASIYK